MDNFGWHQPNGSFDGLIGRLQRHESDFGEVGIFMRGDRLQVCDFIADTFHVRAVIMFRQPPLSAVANIFAKPFRFDVWISLLILIVFIAFVFVLELRLTPDTMNMDYWDCVIFVWGAMCQQGFSVDVYNRSSRLIIFTTFMATLFLFTSFSANIVVLLQSPSQSIKTLSDLTQSPLEIGVQDTVYNKIYFNVSNGDAFYILLLFIYSLVICFVKETTDPVTRQLYLRKIAPKGEKVYMRPIIGIHRMRTELFAYQVEKAAGYQIISDTFSESEKCSLKELEPFQLPKISVATRKDFPYKELFRRL